jgi:ketosteroid isomerase-like protein
MNSSENKAIVQHIFDELGNGNSAPLIESLAEDFRFTVMGTTKWSRVYDGKATVLTELFAPLRARMGGPIHNRPVRLVAEGDLVVVEVRGSNTTAEGRAYNNAYCNVIRLEGGKLKELVEYCDTALVDAVLGDPAETKAAAP